MGDTIFSTILLLSLCMSSAAFRSFLPTAAPKTCNNRLGITPGISCVAKKETFGMPTAHIVHAMAAIQEQPKPDKVKSKLFSYVGKSAKLIFAGSAFVVTLCVESWIPVYYVVFGIINSVISKTLKMILKIERPEKSPKKGYGMPSSHAQAMFYFTTTVAMAGTRNFPGIGTNIALLLLATYTLFASFWRVASHRHSFAQILVGAILGSFIGYVARLGELAIFVEKNIPFLPAALMRRINNITSGEVTFLARLCTLLLGFITLYTAHVIEKLLKIANTKKSVPS